MASGGGRTRIFKRNIGKIPWVLDNGKVMMGPLAAGKKEPS